VEGALKCCFLSLAGNCEMSQTFPLPPLLLVGSDVNTVCSIWEQTVLTSLPTKIQESIPIKPLTMTYCIVACVSKRLKYYDLILFFESEFHVNYQREWRITRVRELFRLAFSDHAPPKPTMEVYSQINLEQTGSRLCPCWKELTHRSYALV